MNLLLFFQSNEEIQKFVKEKYKVKFPVFGKINVIDSDVPPAWKYLIGKINVENELIKGSIYNEPQVPYHVGNNR